MERLKSIFEQVFDKDPFIGPLIFLDTETTGLGNNDKVIEVGAIAISFDGIKLHFSKFSSLLKIDDVLPEVITRITGITDDMLKTAAHEVDVYYDFVKWIDSISPKEIIAHNANFDEGKIRYNLSRVNIFFGFDKKFMCTRVMAIKNNLKTRDHKLGTIGAFFNFDNENVHRAITDAEVCAYVWARMYMENANAGQD